MMYVYVELDKNKRKGIPSLSLIFCSWILQWESLIWLNLARLLLRWRIVCCVISWFLSIPCVGIVELRLCWWTFQIDHAFSTAFRVFLIPGTIFSPIRTTQMIKSTFCMKFCYHDYFCFAIELRWLSLSRNALVKRIPHEYHPY